MAETTEVIDDLRASAGAAKPRRSQRGDKRRGRSRITNGSVFLVDVDGRSPWVRRAKDVIGEHLSDVPQPSAAERSIIRRAAVLTTELERIEGLFAVASATNVNMLDLYVRTAGTLHRLLTSVGLERRAKDIGPTLGDLLRQQHDKARAQQADTVDAEVVP
jgi:hypothetical protein